MEFGQLKRREFITLVGGAAAWPIAAHAQKAKGVRRIGVLSSVPAEDPEVQARMAAFHQGLQEAGWVIGRNLRIEYRWSTAGNTERARQHVNELLALTPEIILAVATSTVGLLQQATRTTPIVFVQVSDPVGAGLVDSLARPGGNTTGFTLFEFSLSAKWVELLKEVAPRTTRAAVARADEVIE
jgi:putative ABC transport system substrate-binding protein